MAAMFLRCGSHPLSAAETPPTLGPSPASRKPSSTAHRLKCLLWRRPGSPRRLAAGHGKRLFCRRALCVLQALPSPPDTRAEVAHLSPGRGPPGAPPSAGGSCMHPAAQIPPFLEGLAHARLPGPAAGVVVQGDGGMRPVGGGSGGGVPCTGTRAATAALRSSPASAASLWSKLARALPAWREARRPITSVWLPGPFGHTKAPSLH